MINKIGDYQFNSFPYEFPMVLILTFIVLLIGLFVLNRIENDIDNLENAKCTELEGNLSKVNQTYWYILPNGTKIDESHLLNLTGIEYGVNT